MKLPDIFDEFDKQFNKIFDEWNKFDDEFDKLFEKAKDDKNTYHYTSHYENFFDSNDDSKSYALTYKYETGMAEPEITIEGNVDDETLEKFVKSIENRYGRGFRKLPSKKIKHLLSGKSRKSKKSETKKEIPSEKIYTFEMPGIGKEDLDIEIKNEILTVTGKRDKLFYEKRVHLPFEPKKDVEVKADNGLINVKIYRKWKNKIDKVSFLYIKKGD